MTQCVTLYSRQGTTDTIEEVEDEQDQGEDKQHVPWESQELDDSPPEDGPWSEPPRGRDGEDGEGLRGEEAAEELAEPTSQVRRGAPWESFGADEGSSLRAEEATCAPSVQDRDFHTESEDGGGQQDFMPTGGRGGLLYTPDTDASKASDADVPPSYSKAVSFDRLDVSDDESDMERKRRMVMTSDSHSDSRSDIVLPSMTTELTASELLLNK